MFLDLSLKNKKELNKNLKMEMQWKRAQNSRFRSSELQKRANSHNKGNELPK